MSSPYATRRVLETLGLDPDTDGPLIEWRTLVSDVWTTDVDRSASLVSYAPSYGRQDAISKPGPVQVSVVGASELADPPEIGDRFRITLCDAAADELGLTEDESARFTGEVTDVQVDPERRTWSVIGIHELARESRVTIDLTTEPAETVQERMLEILDLIGADIGTVDAGGQLVLPPTDQQAASSLLDLTSDSSAGNVVPQLDGNVDWHGRDHRRGAVSRITLTAEEILSAITWAKHVAGVVNIATITYGANLQIVVTDHASVSARGPYPISVATALVERDDAFSLGTLIVGRRAAPAWVLPELQLDVARSVDAAHLADLLKLRHSHRITVSDLPATGPITGTTEFFLEGISESAMPRAWRMGLSVTDPALSGVSIRWIDVTAPTFPPVTLDAGDVTAAGPYTSTIDGGDANAVGAADLEWAAVYPEIRWFDVARIEDPSELGTYERTYDGGLAA